MPKYYNCDHGEFFRGIKRSECPNSKIWKRIDARRDDYMGMSIEELVNMILPGIIENDPDLDELYEKYHAGGLK